MPKEIPENVEETKIKYSFKPTFIPTNKGNFKLTDDIEKVVTGAILQGNYVETAAALAGISKQTFYNWMKKGARYEQALDNGKEPDEDDERIYQFYLKVMQALAYAEASDVQNLEVQSKDNWVVSAWRLERRFPDRWGRKYPEKLEEKSEEINISIKIVE